MPTTRNVRRDELIRPARRPRAADGRTLAVEVRARLRGETPRLCNLLAAVSDSESRRAGRRRPGGDAVLIVFEREPGRHPDPDRIGSSLAGFARSALLLRADGEALGEDRGEACLLRRQLRRDDVVVLTMHGERAVREIEDGEACSRIGVARLAD